MIGCAQDKLGATKRRDTAEGLHNRGHTSAIRDRRGEGLRVWEHGVGGWQSAVDCASGRGAGQGSSRPYGEGSSRPYGETLTSRNETSVYNALRSERNVAYRKLDWCTLGIFSG